jgi:hypothetical protein
VRIGDAVRVRTNGRHAVIVSELPDNHYQVEFLPEADEDPIDRDSPEWQGEGGIYEADQLEPI